MIIVSPYRPLAAYEVTTRHSEGVIGQFDWLAALRMLASTADRYGYPVFALSDRPLPVRHYRFDQTDSPLMIWILEVSLAYLESSYFSQDTAFISPDSLINAPLPSMVDFDLGVCVRFAHKYRHKRILNSVQLWPVASRARLIGFYRQCLEIARSSPLGGGWGADTVPLVDLLTPFVPGIQGRAGMTVNMMHSKNIIHTITSGDMMAIERGCRLPSGACVIDFKGHRKKHMGKYYEAAYENR